MDYRIQTKTEGINFSEVCEILAYYGLSNFDVETQKRVVNNSYAVVFVIENNKVIGVGRAISDGICQAALYNIALDKEHCGMGLGKIIVDELLKQVKGCNVILYTHPKWKELYKHWGFEQMKTGFALYTDKEYFQSEGFI